MTVVTATALMSKIVAGGARICEVSDDNVRPARSDVDGDEDQGLEAAASVEKMEDLSAQSDLETRESMSLWSRGGPKRDDRNCYGS